jgi:UDP-N-acetylglucosamine--N-acetylmuramyl-(pentapeptide) pyrophosphoryl-undecaprenol N-acetylglucosamine transferase
VSATLQSHQPNTSHRVVLTGGGTGGHLVPALALAQQFQPHPEVEAVLYIGNAQSLEARKVPEAGVPFESIAFYGMPRRIDPLAWIRWVWALWVAVRRAKGLLEAFRPTVVVGTGGYVSGPVLLAARWLGVPYWVHEPDAYPGLVNRLVAPAAAQVSGAFEAARPRLKTKRFLVSGNPLRGTPHPIDKAEALAQLGLSWSADQPVLVILGGSQGARTLNRAVAQALPTLMDELGLAVIHQTGESLYEETLLMLPPQWQNHPRYCVRPYYEAMQAVWSAATLAVCRSGSLTLSELYAYGVPSVLVPFPFAAANHQVHNAKASVAAGASSLLLDGDCDGPALVQAVRALLSQPQPLVSMATAAQGLARPEATAQLVDAILRLGA